MLRIKLILCFGLYLSFVLLSGCLGTVVTGATLVYDRHDVYKEFDDFQLAADANRALYKDKVFKCTACYLDIAVFNGDVLLAGHVPTRALRAEAQRRVNLPGYRRLFNQLGISQKPKNLVQDSWITAKIRSEILRDASIDPDQFKIVTVDQIVYLMGDVFPVQAQKVIDISRNCDGVERVVKLFRYYHLSNKP